MSDDLGRWRTTLGNNLRSPWWGSAMVASVVWWISDARWDLAEKANDALDRWAIPVASDVLRLLLRLVAAGLWLPLVVVSLILIHAYLESRRARGGSEAAAATDDLPFVITIAEPYVRSDTWDDRERAAGWHTTLRLKVENLDGPDGEFEARVIDSHGEASGLPTPPWYIAWRHESADRAYRLSPGNSELLRLATSTYGGRLKVHTPTADYDVTLGHSLADPNPDDRLGLRVRVWNLASGIYVDQDLEIWLEKDGGAVPNVPRIQMVGP